MEITKLFLSILLLALSLNLQAQEAAESKPIARVAAGDVAGDGLLDIVVGNKKGAFVHLHSVKKVGKKQWQAAQPKRIH